MDEEELGIVHPFRAGVLKASSSRTLIDKLTSALEEIAKALDERKG